MRIACPVGKYGNSGAEGERRGERGEEVLAKEEGRAGGEESGAEGE